MTQEPLGGWLAAEKGRQHFDSSGWCRCCCDDCYPVGCSHASNPAGCMAHPLDAETEEG